MMEEIRSTSPRNHLMAAVKKMPGFLKFCIVVALALAFLWVMAGEWLVGLAEPPIEPNESFFSKVIYFFWPLSFAMIVVAVFIDSYIESGYTVASGRLEGISFGCLSAVTTLYALLPIVLNQLSRLFWALELEGVAQFFFDWRWYSQEVVLAIIVFSGVVFLAVSFLRQRENLLRAIEHLQEDE